MINYFYGTVVLVMMKCLMNISYKKVGSLFLIYSFVSMFLLQMKISSVLIDIILLETLCVLLFYFVDHPLTEIIFYCSFMCLLKNLLPFSDYFISCLFVYIIIAFLIVYLKKQYPVAVTNMYWGLLCVVSLSTLLIYHILYHNFLSLLDMEKNHIILMTLFITICISYYLFLRYSMLSHKQKLLKMAVDNFKNEQKQYEYIEKKNKELYKLRHDLKYDYLYMRQCIQKQQYEHINSIIKEKLNNLNHDDEIIFSGHKLVDSFINMKLDQAKQKDIMTSIVVSLHDLSYIDDEHLNIIINYLFDLGIEASLQNQKKMNIKIIEDKTVFEITISLPGKIPDHLNTSIIETLQLLLKKYNGHLDISTINDHEFYISLLIPAN